MTERLFVDTSAWFAFSNRSDPAHAATAAALKRYDGGLVTSNYVFDETVTLFRARVGHDAACRVGAVLQNATLVHVIRITVDDEIRAWELFLDRSDKSYSFTDCTSFILLRRLRLDLAATLDDDFRQEGFQTLPHVGPRPAR